MATPDELFDLWLDHLEELGVDAQDEFEVEEIVVPAFEESTGLSHLGSGRSRSVFALDEDRVVKLSIDPQNESNLFECSMWLENRYDPKRAEWLAPVLECADDGSWLVMRRAEPASAEAVKDLLFSPARYELYALGAQDWMHPMQWGVIDGRLKLVDYGWGFGTEDALAELKQTLMPPG